MQLPLWEMESRWTPKTSDGDFRGQNSMACVVFYIIGKLLEHRCLKWAYIAHLDIWHKLWPKEGPWVKLSIWLPTKKSQESTWFTCLQMACDIPLESSWQGLQLCFRLHLDSRSTRKVMGLQNYESPNKTKNHLDVGLVERCRVYYNGEGGGFPQVRAMVSLVCPCCPWLVLAPKVLQLRTNYLVWVLCRPVWVSEACQHFLVPSWSSNTPFYPSRCYELGSIPRLFFLLLFYI
jgi:hypothetical protein